MSYGVADSVLEPWAASHELHIHTLFKDVEVRSIDVVSKNGKRFQIWIDPPDQAGTTEVHVWDMKNRRMDYSATLATLENQLEAAYQQAINWF